MRTDRRCTFACDFGNLRMFSVFENEKDYGKSFGEDGILNSTSAMGKESRIGSLY